jgi:hypothetical protein
MSRNALTLSATLAVLTALGGSVSAVAGETPAPKNAPVIGAKLEAAPAKKVEAAVATSKAPVSNPKAVEIVNRYLEALGGSKVLEAINDRTTKFRVIKHAATGETKAAMNLFLKKDYKIREEWDIEGLKIKDKPLAFVQVYNGTEGWVQMFGTVSPLEGKTLSLFVWDKLLDDMFCHWEEDGYTLDYAGPGTVDNDPVEVVETTDFGGTNKAKYFFSKQSGLLVKREWREQGQQGMAKKETFFKKYKKLPFSDQSGKAVQFPLLQEIYEDGDLDTSREYNEVQINSGLKDGIFERPEGEEFKGAITGATPSEPPAGGAAGGAPVVEKVRGGHPPIGKGAHPTVGGPKKDAAPTAPPAPPAPEKK